MEILNRRNISQLKLGGKAPRVDKRTIRLTALWRPELLPPLPDSYDLDTGLGIRDDFMFANDKYGDCVIAGRAHMTLRFEAFEQKEQISIRDDEVVSEYMRESNNEANGPGLVMLDSLNEWRQSGWVVGGKTYTIYAFGALDWKNHDEVKYCIYLLGGVYLALALPLTAQSQLSAGQPWQVVNPGSAEAAPASWGYHCVYGPAWNSGNSPSPSKCHVGTGIARSLNVLPNVLGRRGRFYYLNPSVKVAGYNTMGPELVTWGVRQQASWEWWDAYCSEVYGVVDNRDDWLGDHSPVDVNKLDELLSEITA